MSYGAFGVKPQVQAGAYIKKEQASYIRANDGWGSTGSNGSAWGSGHRVCGSGSSGRPNGRGLGGREGKWTRGADSGAATNDVSPPPCTPVVCPPLTTPAQDAHSHKPYDLRLPKEARFSVHSSASGRPCVKTSHRDAPDAETLAHRRQQEPSATRSPRLPGDARRC
jgi:hypothetical protein